MRSWLAQKFAQTATNQTIVTTAETAVQAITAPTMQSPDGSVLLEGACEVNPIGATTTSITVKVYRGAIGGTLVGQLSQENVTAAGTAQISIQVIDTPAVELANQTYTMSVTCNAATTNSTVTVASLAATVT